MKSIGSGATRAARHRRFYWCRRPNGFSDLPLWRIVAERLSMPLYQVLAFVNRLEELGNAAANFGDGRGYVGRFKAEEFAQALGMAAEEAARIFAVLEDPDIGWVAFDHIADFYDRNPDREDETAAERKRRQRLRDAIRRQLSRLAGLGKVDERERRSIEDVLSGTEQELRELQARLAQLELAKNLSTGDPVTRDGRMSQRDIVTVTPEKSRGVTGGPVDNSGGGTAAQGSAGMDEVGRAELWLETEGLQAVTERMNITRQLAETTMARWRRDIGDDTVALARIVGAAVATTLVAAQFHVLIADAIRRVAAGGQPSLPLAPVALRRAGDGR